MGMQGWRRTMEDSHIAHTDLDNGVSLFGVFDGHGGKSLFHSLTQATLSSEFQRDNGKSNKISVSLICLRQWQVF